MRYAQWMAALALVSACGSAPAHGNAQPNPDNNSNATVFKRGELSGTLLDALRTRYPRMIVSQQTGQCPLIILRGDRLGRNQGNPSVYVDDTLMLDTCILTQINGNDVERLEIFPGGIVSKPTIQRNPFGVIMVYRIH